MNPMEMKPLMLKVNADTSQAEAALKKLAPAVPSLRTRRFEVFVIAEAMLFVLSIIALWLKADAALTAIVLGHVLTLGATALGFGNWHDAKVRESMTVASIPLPPIETKPADPA